MSGAVRRLEPRSDPPLNADHAALIREMHRQGFMAQPACNHAPAPTDREAERDVVSGLLSGLATVSDLGGLEPEHFESPFARVVAKHSLALLGRGEQVSPVTIAKAVQAARDDGPGLLAALGEVLLFDAVRLPLRPRVQRVIANARKRQLWRELHRLLAELSFGDMTRDDIYQRGRQLFGPFRGSTPHE